MTDREMLCRVRLYTDDSKSSESGSKKEPQREEVKNEKAKIDTRSDWVLCATSVICLVMMGFSAGCGELLVAASFAMNLVCVVLLMTIRKEMKNGKE